MPRQFTYGPFKSRRLGLSLGVDILPKCKKCTFNCIYCEIGSTKPDELISPESSINFSHRNSFRKEFRSIVKYVKDLDSITFGYNGEPTLNTNLDEFFSIAKDIRNEVDWEKKEPNLTLFTNSSTLYRKEIRDIVKKFDLILAKLDSATKEDFLRTNRPHEKVQSIEEIINSIAKLKLELPQNHKLAIQCLLYQSYEKDFIANINEKNINKLAKAINKIEPNIVQLYSIARIPAEYFVYALDRQKLTKIKKKLRKAISSSIKVYCY